MGGVEGHLYQLSLMLTQRGHKVIIITHSYGNRTGVRYLTNGLKVYYVPHMVIYSEATLPTIYGFFPIFRNIILRERINIVHGHQAFSSLCHEAILHARTMGMRVCFTDHSLFGFADASSILMNKVLKFTLSDIDHVICVSGDGPKRIDLEQMREKNLLHDRVEFLGSVMHHEVHSVLTKGHIFLNTSLTEAFCIGMVEAACCGLLVVSTKVGGVPEVLPRHMIIFSKPEEEDLVNAVLKAIKMIRLKEAVPTKFHDEIKEMYSWSNVAERTEKVYDKIWKLKTPPLMERLRRYYGCGIWAGKIFCIVMAVDYLFWRFLEWLFPTDEIDIAPAFPYQKYRKMCQMADEDDKNS
ncbi:3985_t:CDS:2 [Gigaspora margarita]|uniref:3985_t:CDS:1 n=1 Tax=Gigaspora margarita TaxID=4874 RepID=A0ABN7UTW4_GIGMA|nr:3985_t:CDS:2 [Gigaspora margarita]